MGGLIVEAAVVLNEDNPEFFNELMKKGVDAVEPEMKRQKAKREEKITTKKVVECRYSKFKEIGCLESNTQYGFFKNDNDIRPPSCTWIDKDKAEKLFKLFAKGRLSVK